MYKEANQAFEVKMKEYLKLQQKFNELEAENTKIHEAINTLRARKEKMQEEINNLKTELHKTKTLLDTQVPAQVFEVPNNSQSIVDLEANVRLLVEINDELNEKLGKNTDFIVNWTTTSHVAVPVRINSYIFFIPCI